MVTASLSVNVFTVSNPRVPLGLVCSQRRDEHSCLHVDNVQMAVGSCAQDVATVCNAGWDRVQVTALDHLKFHF